MPIGDPPPLPPLTGDHNWAAAAPVLLNINHTLGKIEDRLAEIQRTLDAIEQNR